MGGRNTPPLTPSTNENEFYLCSVTLLSSNNQCEDFEKAPFLNNQPQLLLFYVLEVPSITNVTVAKFEQTVFTFWVNAIVSKNLF